ncbi:hypothetical protein QQ020_17945 [Fulvivirgaceae bacterium BMA12]|uniref:DNA polymerase III psi subunit n=1 Tax=Agaribacillus aureus TaxID=3051825 RepID=A0ABT8LCD5_9BACT|nr:hypothetical protein [Fulvivirgaceae bacterium BMA12]
MSKDYTFLPNLIQEDLYYIESESTHTSTEKSPLIQTDNKETHTETAPEVMPGKAENTEAEGLRIDFKGENLKNILVLIEEPNGSYLKSEDEAFLEKVLKAVDINLIDIAIVNYSSLSEEQARKIEAVPHWLCLGFMEALPAPWATLATERYQTIQHDENKILWGHPLKSIAGDKDMKVRLWQQLKLLFNK